MFDFEHHRYRQRSHGQNVAIMVDHDGLLNAARLCVVFVRCTERIDINAFGNYVACIGVDTAAGEEGTDFGLAIISDMFQVHIKLIDQTSQCIIILDEAVVKAQESEICLLLFGQAVDEYNDVGQMQLLDFMVW